MVAFSVFLQTQPSLEEFKNVSDPMNRRFFISFASTLFLSAPFAGHAAEDAPILTVNDGYTGNVTTFTQEDLLALPQISFDTATVWSTEVSSFSGPSLTAVLNAAGVDAANSGVRLYAINDYNVEFPAAQIEQDSPILANRINGEAFSIRDKGPLWLVFPFDEDPRYQTEEIFALSVWQLTQIDVLTD